MAKKTETKKTNNKPRRARPSNCYFTHTNTTPDYKEVLVLRRFINDRGKLLPNKYSGLSSKNQRLLATEVKKARYMGLLPYTDRHSL